MAGVNFAIGSLEAVILTLPVKGKNLNSTSCHCFPFYGRGSSPPQADCHVLLRKDSQ